MSKGGLDFCIIRYIHGRLLTSPNNVPGAVPVCRAVEVMVSAFTVSSAFVCVCGGGNAAPATLMGKNLGRIKVRGRGWRKGTGHTPGDASDAHRKLPSGVSQLRDRNTVGQHSPALLALQRRGVLEQRLGPPSVRCPMAFLNMTSPDLQSTLRPHHSP